MYRTDLGSKSFIFQWNKAASKFTSRKRCTKKEVVNIRFAQGKRKHDDVVLFLPLALIENIFGLSTPETFHNEFLVRNVSCPKFGSMHRRANRIRYNFALLVSPVFDLSKRYCVLGHNISIVITVTCNHRMGFLLFVEVVNILPKNTWSSMIVSSHIISVYLCLAA